MATPEDVDMKEGGGTNIHKPFTVEENIQQLNSIDSAVVDLMNHTSAALNALTIPSSAAPIAATNTTSQDTGTASDSAEKPPLNTASQKQAFRDATDSFLSTLHSVDVRLKRQIMALEEAGIVNFSDAPRPGPKGGTVKPSLKPNGVGAVGNLDVGWLNSRGSRVERDMESEIWSNARDFLEKEGGKANID